MTPSVQLANKLDVAYRALEELLIEQASVESDLCAAQMELVEARAEILRTREAKDLGPNVEVREAQIAVLLTEQRQKVAAGETKRLEARLQVEVARLRIENLRAHLRLLEVAVGLPRAA